MTEILEDPVYFKTQEDFSKSLEDSIDNQLENSINNQLEESSGEPSILTESISKRCAWCNEKPKAMLEARTQPPTQPKLSYYRPAPYNLPEIVTTTPLTEPYVDKHLCFCNFVCAKLYHDNIHKLDLDTKKYRDLYISGKLSRENKSIYDRVCKLRMGFDQIPIERFTEKNCPKTIEERRVWSKKVASSI